MKGQTGFTLELQNSMKTYGVMGSGFSWSAERRAQPGIKEFTGVDIRRRKPRDHRKKRGDRGRDGYVSTVHEPRGESGL